ncbi:hypothetical protein EB796_010619 [Bugula neritina]|uniref:EGF-like domain-containing protein n=1 Tax=Bugula neritina TaxID=10212 RepID=A0A7J7JZG5_BUGNE|nr:hypothetical protein EB796_010619 [Bugula neritina]
MASYLSVFRALCVHKCDPRSTTCEGVPAAKYYICNCKKNFEPIPNDIRRCKATDECVEPGKPCPVGKQCVEEYGILICRDSLLDSCNSWVCGNHGKCSTFRNGSVACSCTEGYSGTRCDIKIVKKSERDDLEKILIGVGVGLGTLAFFCAIALIITCCGDRGKGFNSSYSPVKKTSMQYFNDDVTIDNWEPSLPRPKIKPGAFDSTYGDGIEMREKRGNTDGDKDGRLGATGRENPAFIPEADYDIGNGRNGRLVANGKPETGDYVYF